MRAQYDQVGVDILEALGFNLKEEHVSKMVLTVQVNEIPTLEITKEVWPTPPNKELRKVVAQYELRKKE